ncbi:MAG TPA: hypothetical protein VMD28_04295 [Acidimicrobiales bacterium]|nr:hypothetical protein [Acidimicrobiales bacterium]
MVGGSSNCKSLGARLRASVIVAALPVAALAGTAWCGGSLSAPPASATTSVRATWSATAPATGSCTGVPGAHHARLVVEPAVGRVVARCVGFSGKEIPALTLLKDSRLEVGTQTFSFGVAICQVDDVPAHYTQCLPSGRDYWALFLSANGRSWTSPSVGVSDIKVPPGGSLGLRYDSPNGTPAPPPHPTPA